MILNKFLTILLGLICIILLLALANQQTMCENLQENYCQRQFARVMSGGEYYDPAIGGVVKIKPNVTNITLNISIK